MNQEIANVIRTADLLRAATNEVAGHVPMGDGVSFFLALNALDASTEALRRAPRVPPSRELWMRRITIETIYWPSVYFDAEHNGEALQELIDELEDYGTCGVPREVTHACCAVLRAGMFEGLLARVRMRASAEACYEGVVAAEDLEALAVRAVEWGDAVRKAYRPGLTLAVAEWGVRDSTKEAQA